MKYLWANSHYQDKKDYLMRKIRAKAPLRLGLAGGGTDVSPFSDHYGGYVLNATINKYANVFLEVDENHKKVTFNAIDLDIVDECMLDDDFALDKGLILHRMVYKKMMNVFNNGEYMPLRMLTYCASPPGSGLGSSSTIVVAMIEAYKELLNLPLGEYEVAKLAFEIERIDCGFDGGKQDQYAATFGGFNFMEFGKEDRVLINPLRIRKNIIYELETNLLLYYLGASRDSGEIIKHQAASVASKSSSLEAMHAIKKNAWKSKEMLLKGDIENFSSTFLESWSAKKRTSKSITNPIVQRAEEVAFKNGAKSLKISGAGGGGFMVIFVNPEKREHLIRALSKIGGQIHEFNFTTKGSISWTI